MKDAYNRRAQKPVKWPVGQKVYLEATNIKTDCPSKKLDDKRYGPFEILGKVSESSFKLKLLETWKAIHPVFHSSLLTEYREPRFVLQQKPPPPPAVEVEGLPEYEVECILAE
jgi:hypothetical protein